MHAAMVSQVCSHPKHVLFLQRPTLHIFIPCSCNIWCQKWDQNNIIHYNNGIYYIILYIKYLSSQLNSHHDIAVLFHLINVNFLNAFCTFVQVSRQLCTSREEAGQCGDSAGTMRPTTAHYRCRTKASSLSPSTDRDRGSLGPGQPCVRLCRGWVQMHILKSNINTTRLNQIQTQIHCFSKFQLKYKYNYKFPI